MAFASKTGSMLHFIRSSIADCFVVGNSANSLPMISSPNLATSITTNASIEPQAPEPAPMFIAPPGFRPNSLFFGMSKELSQIDERLFNQKQRESGSVAVLLHGVS